jgi:hypothetical protein
MRYMLLIHDDEKAWNDLPPATIGAVMEKWGAFQAEIEGSGVMQSCARLKPAGTATLLRTAKGKSRVTDGPYLEAKEQCGGYYLIDVEDLDAALAWAQKVPMAVDGAVEIRPIWEMDEPQS